MRHEQSAKVTLSATAWKTILLDAHGRQQIEACGALLGTIDHAGNWQVEEAYPLLNIAASPVYFEFDPAELLTIDLQQPGRMVGVYHSHPTGPAVASSTDRQNMQRVNLEQRIPWVWLIVSGPFDHARAKSAARSEEGKPEKIISARGLIAYHHYQDTGLQKIAIEKLGNEDIRPLQRP
ncbi:MAG TPA: M67 family metallopeptidase [Ktedonobacteraceae bacterium]|jgi:proteasome lid subunit RPN8/RPN11